MLQKSRGIDDKDSCMAKGITAFAVVNIVILGHVEVA